MLRGEQFYVGRAAQALPDGLPVAAVAAYLHWAAAAPFAVPAVTDPASLAHARVDHGRWVVDCPFCPSAQVAFETDRRYLCADCGNAAVGGAWVRVLWPPDPAVIEGLLRPRPPAHRSWRPAETVEQLEAENRLHGY